MLRSVRDTATSRPDGNARRLRLSQGVRSTLLAGWAYNVYLVTAHAV